MEAAALLPRTESSTCLAKMLFTVTALVSEANRVKPLTNRYLLLWLNQTLKTPVLSLQALLIALALAFKYNCCHSLMNPKVIELQLKNTNDHHHLTVLM